MSDTHELLRKYDMKTFSRPPGAARGAEAAEEVAESRCFGYLRGVGDRALNLEFRRGREADSFALPYSWLGPHYYHPSLGIVLVFGGPLYYVVRIRGCHLNAPPPGVGLYERGILFHRVTYVREVGAAPADAAHAEGECMVERIDAVVARNDEELLTAAGWPFAALSIAP